MLCDIVSIQQSAVSTYYVFPTLHISYILFVILFPCEISLPFRWTCNSFFLYLNWFVKLCILLLELFLSTIGTFRNQNINIALTLPLVSRYRFLSYIRAHSSAVFLKLNRVLLFVSFGYRQIDGLRHEVARGHRQIDSLYCEVVRGHREIEILRNEVVRLPSPE